MAPRTQRQTFRRLDGFPRIVQDNIAMLRSLYIGSVVADRDFFRSGRPGMNVNDYERIDDPDERAEYMELCAKLKRITRFPNTQTRETLEFFTSLGLDPNTLTAAQLPLIQEKMADRYRIVFVNYQTASELCFLNWSGKVVRARVITIVSDGVSWDALSNTNGVYGKYLCPGCLKPSRSSKTHRCQFTCTSCNSLLATGNCDDGLKIICSECNFSFKSEKCFRIHKHVSAQGKRSRCDDIRYCIGCDSVYRTTVGPHICGNSIYCVMCENYTNNQHDCTWAKFTDKDRERLLKKQAEFRFCFYDCETNQNEERDDGEFEYAEHFVTTIGVLKVCHLCEFTPIDSPCRACGVRKRIFQYERIDEDKYKVVDDFVRFLMTDPTMKGRFDGHLIITGFHRLGILPKTVDKGSSLIRIEDSYCLIPMALSAFPRAFDLDCEEKGTFPHLANMRANWFRKWPSIPDKKYFSYKYMKPEQQKSFDQWYEGQIGKEFDQRAELEKYCSGYGALNQSIIALKYIRWRESKLPYELIHSLSPKGEEKVTVGNHQFSVDCFDPKLKKILEIMGCWFHGCRKCFPDGTRLVGGELAEELRARTERRIALLRTKYEVEVQWECSIKAELESVDGMKEFFDKQEIIERLRMRDALYGGRVEVLRSYLKATNQMAIKYYDICSMYPAVMSLMEYPLGHPQVITSNFKPITGRTFPYRGIVKLKVLPPQNLKVGAIPYRFGGALYFTLCAACAQNKTQRCDHPAELRAWIGTYATVEIELALEKNYQILKVYEVYHWDEWSGEVYRNYFKTFIKRKFAASGFPAGVVTHEQKLAWCAKVSARLGFDLTPDEVEESSSMRVVCKLSNNSAWGKLAEQPSSLKTEYIDSTGFYALRTDASRIVTRAKMVEMPDGRELVKVTHKPRVETIRANRHSAVHHAVLITAQARVLLYRIVDLVGDRACYMDTDSIIFEMDRQEEDPLGHLLDGTLGNLADEIKEGWEVDEVVISGCKNYSMRIVNNSTGDVEIKQALRGVTKDQNALTTLTHEKMYEASIEKSVSHVDIARPELKRTLGHIHTDVVSKRWRPVSFKRATRGEGESEFKVPYGYLD